MGNGVAFRKGIAASNSEEGAPPGISYLTPAFPHFLAQHLGWQIAAGGVRLARAFCGT